MHLHSQLGPDSKITLPELPSAQRQLPELRSESITVALGSVGLLSPLGPATAEAYPVLDHCVQAGALHIIYLHVLHEVTHLRYNEGWSVNVTWKGLPHA